MSAKRKVITISQLSPCERVAVLEDALFALSSGQQRARVHHNEFELEFHRGSASHLQLELTRERAICNAETASGSRRAITIGRSGVWPKC